MGNLGKEQKVVLFMLSTFSNSCHLNYGDELSNIVFGL